MGTRPHPALPANVLSGPDLDRRTSEGAASKGEIKTRFLLLSDTHGHPLFPSSRTDRAYRSPLPTSDVLIHAGDLSQFGRLSEYRRTFDVVKSSDAEFKIVIAGNHDASLDPPYWRSRVDDGPKGEEDCKQAYDLWTGKEALDNGIIYLEEGLHTFKLKNGAKFTIYTSPFTPEFCDMAFPYERGQDRFNPSGLAPLSASPAFEAPNPIPSLPAIDIVVTHGPPQYHMDEVNRSGSVGCFNLLRALQRVRPRLSVFGHIHEGWGAEFVKWEPHWPPVKDEAGQVEKASSGSQDVATILEHGHAYINISKDGEPGLDWGSESLLVNAAILDRMGRPVNAPWVVDLDLPKA